MNESSSQDIKIVKDSDVLMLIPACCREGFESCTHVLKKEKPRKRNIGL